VVAAVFAAAVLSGVVGFLDNAQKIRMSDSSAENCTP
jgi:hypothetical protein